MAAAEYFSNKPMTQTAPPAYEVTTPHPQAPTSHPQSNQQTPQPQPQYQEQRPGVHFAPRPIELPARHSFSDSQRPPRSSWDSPPQQHSGRYQPQNVSQYRPSPPNNGSPYNNSPNGYGTPPQKPQYLSPHMRPYANPNFSQSSFDNSGGYHSDPESRRRRHRRHDRRDSGDTRDVSSTRRKSDSRSTKTDAFLGAAGGGLVGDLIFPGLGTIGGAAIGWLGGKDYAKHRKGREEKRAVDQKKWEKKHRPDEYRARDRSR